jgi:hypothetical protein
MVRRGGMFGASTDAQSLIPLGSDEGPVLENKWKKWVQREAFKRCVKQRHRAMQRLLSLTGT